MAGLWAALGLVGAAVRRAVFPATARLLLRRREELLDSRWPGTRRELPRARARYCENPSIR